MAPSPQAPLPLAHIPPFHPHRTPYTPDSDPRTSLHYPEYYNHTVIVRQILDYACRPEVGLISSNPMDHVKVNSKLFKRVQKKEANTQVFSEDEEKALKQTCLNSYFNGPKSKKPQHH